MLSATFCGVKSMYEFEPLSLPPVLLRTVSCGSFQYPPTLRVLNAALLRVRSQGRKEQWCPRKTCLRCRFLGRSHAYWITRRGWATTVGRFISPPVDSEVCAPGPEKRCTFLTAWRSSGPPCFSCSFAFLLSWVLFLFFSVSSFLTLKT